MKNLKLKEKFKDLNRKKIYDAFYNACKDGDIKIIDYLVNSKDVKFNIKNYNRFMAVTEAIDNKHLNVLKYLVKNTYLKKKLFPYVQNNWVLDSIRRNEDIPMLQYLILELNIEKTEFMENFLNISNTEYRNTVFNLFKTRELKNSLNQDLDKKIEITAKKTKI